MWKTQVLAFIIGNALKGFINGDKPYPAQFLSKSSEKSSRSSAVAIRQTKNLEYIMWKKPDKLFQSWLLSSMMDNVLIMVVSCETSQDLWERPAEIFISQSKAQFMPLMMQIQTTKRGSLSISDYFNNMKKISDALAFRGGAFSSNEFIMHILGRLDDFHE